MKDILSKTLIPKNVVGTTRWQDDKPSESAKSVAKLKYVASRLKNSTLEKFAFEKELTTPLFRLISFLFLEQFKNYIERKSPGLLGSMIARTMFIDEAIYKYLNKVEQIVIIGAGFDGRAYHHLNTHPKVSIPGHVSIYELDLAPTLASKKILVSKLKNKRENVFFKEFDAERII